MVTCTKEVDEVKMNMYFESIGYCWVSAQIESTKLLRIYSISREGKIWKRKKLFLVKHLP